MSSENHANYVRIGFVVFLGIVALVGALIYIGGLRGRGDELLVETCYDKPVSGLAVGSPVNFRGVKIGEVREISFIGHKYKVKGADISRIYILMAIRRDSLSPEPQDEFAAQERVRMLVDRLGLRATVTASGITGLSRIECDFCLGESYIEPPAISWTPRFAYIPPKISLLDNFSDSATKVMNQINRMDLITAWSNVSATVESVARMTDSVKTMLETRQADINRLLDDLSATSTSVKEFMSELRRNPSLLIRERVSERLDETR